MPRGGEWRLDLTDFPVNCALSILFVFMRKCKKNAAVLYKYCTCVYSTYLGVAFSYWFLIFVARKAGELRLPGHGQGSRGEGAQADNQNSVFSIKNPIVNSSRIKGIVPRDS
jgi:hypothetical protein